MQAVLLIALSCILFIVGALLLFSGRKAILRLIGLIILLIGVLFFTLYMNLRSYAAFTREELIAKVTCVPKKGQLYDMVLKFTPILGGRPHEEQVYLLKGNQWLIDGEILKWTPALNILGFKTVYKITRISGRYLYPEDKYFGPKNSYAINGGTDNLWIFLHKCQKLFPFVEAVYGNGAYTFADKNATFGIYVTISGFIIKRM